MQEDSFIEKFKASLGDKSLSFSNTLGRVFSKEKPEVIIVDAPKVAIDKEDYEIMAVSWKEVGASEEREELRQELKKVAVIAKLHTDKSFVDGINFVLDELDERDKKND
jgi:hypothetical protein